MTPAVRLFVGGQVATLPGPDGTRERENLGGPRCFTAAHRPFRAPYPADTTVLLDSGAFSDNTLTDRLTWEAALTRQLDWEATAARLWDRPGWQATALASYDYLIDETWTGAERRKQRWTVKAAERAVNFTIYAAEYLHMQRATLAPRTLVLGVQGVNAAQYTDCVQQVLRVSRPGDWIGLGGWCILGRQKSLLPAFWATLPRVLPLIAGAGIRHVHLYGVLWPVPLGGLLWWADAVGVTVSCDSLAPLLACTHKARRADGYHGHGGLRAAYWRDNVVAWQTFLADLRATPYYTRPPAVFAGRQLSLLEAVA